MLLTVYEALELEVYARQSNQVGYLTASGELNLGSICQVLNGGFINIITYFIFHYRYAPRGIGHVSPPTPPG